MRFTPALFLALPLLVSAASRPAKSYVRNPLLTRDDDDDTPEEEDDLHRVCSIDGKEPKDCGSGYCCYYYEECRPGGDDQDYPFCMDMSWTTLGSDPVSVGALMFDSTGFPSTAAATATGDSDDKTTDGSGPTNTAAANPSESSGAAVNNKVVGVLGVGAIAGLAGVFF